MDGVCCFSSACQWLQDHWEDGGSWQLVSAHLPGFEICKVHAHALLCLPTGYCFTQTAPERTMASRTQRVDQATAGAGKLHRPGWTRRPLMAGSCPIEDQTAAGCAL